MKCRILFIVLAGAAIMCFAPAGSKVQSVPDSIRNLEGEDKIMGLQTLAMTHIGEGAHLFFLNIMDSVLHLFLQCRHA